MTHTCAKCGKSCGVSRGGVNYQREPGFCWICSLEIQKQLRKVAKEASNKGKETLQHILGED